MCGPVDIPPSVTAVSRAQRPMLAARPKSAIFQDPALRLGRGLFSGVVPEFRPWRRPLGHFLRRYTASERSASRASQTPTKAVDASFDEVAPLRKHRLYRDRACASALEEFLDRVARGKLVSRPIEAFCNAEHERSSSCAFATGLREQNGAQKNLLRRTARRKKSTSASSKPV
jgi:hypothetical protein